MGFRYLGVVLAIMSLVQFTTGSMCNSTQIYTVKIVMNWNASTDTDFRLGMYVGGVFAVAHGEHYKLIFPGTPAWPRYQTLIEQDEIQRFYSRLDFDTKGVNARVSNFSYVVSGNRSNTITLNIEMDGTKNHTYLSFLGALVGTPDYFFAMRDPINMCMENGSFALQFPPNSSSIPVTAYDAGYNARKVITDNSSVIPEYGVITVDNRTSLIHPYATYTVEQFISHTSASCFPASATVSLENGNILRMDELKVGDRVAVGRGKFSEVYLFTHKLPGVVSEFVSILLENRIELRMTSGHYLILNHVYKPAKLAQIEDIVVLEDGSFSKIIKVSRVIDWGLYNPQTIDGEILVNNVLVSTYTTALSPKIAHALLTPFRLTCSALNFELRMFEGGAIDFSRLFGRSKHWLRT